MIGTLAMVGGIRCRGRGVTPAGGRRRALRHGGGGGREGEGGGDWLCFASPETVTESPRTLKMNHHMNFCNRTLAAPARVHPTHGHSRGRTGSHSLVDANE